HVKDRCNRAIERRLGHLDQAETRLANATVLTDDHAATLAVIIDDTQAGLTTLQADIAAATEPEVVRELCGRIAPDYRVYLVVLPQAHLTVGADRVDVATDRAEEAIEKFDEALAAAEAAGADITEATALRDEAAAHVDTAEDAAEGMADSVLAVTPESYNNGSGAADLDAARSALRTSREELKQAHASAKAAVEALREAIDDI
ncbi:MAG: hypothetical protein ACE5GB_08090, partial [Acidimicrobiales bacterium]